MRPTSWSGLGPVLSSRRGYELRIVPLPWLHSRMGPRVCTAHCLGTQVRPECTLNILVCEATSFALQMEGAAGCACCSGITRSRAVEWAAQLPVCSGQVPR